METKKIDHFYEVQTQMHTLVQKRKHLQMKAGQKLVHCKLRGSEDIAEEFKRLVKLKSLGTYFAVREAQMQPLIATNDILPSKEAQRRIEGTEREIFALLSADNAKHEAPSSNGQGDFQLSNCLEIVNEKLLSLNSKLKTLSLVESELDEKDVYTNDGFLKRDVEMKESLQKEKQDLETKMGTLEKGVQGLTSVLEEDKMQLSEAEGKITALQSLTNSKKQDIQNADAAFRDEREQSSRLREERNRILCRALLQRKTLNVEMTEDLKIKTTESLHTKKQDIESELRERSAKLRMLKMKEADLNAEEKNLKVAGQTQQAQLEEIKQENLELDEKICGVRESDTRISRDLETCMEDVENEMDVSCTIWRDRALKNIFNAGLLDVSLFKNISFSDKDKHKFPAEQYQIMQCLKPELGMVEGGIVHLQHKLTSLRSEMGSLHNRYKTIVKQRAVKEREFKESERVVEKADGRLDRLEELHKSLLKTEKNQLELLAELIPRTNILETLDQTTKEELLSPILKGLEGAGEIDDVITQYNVMKKEILTEPEKYQPAVANEFLLKEWSIQLQLEEKLSRQIEHIEGKATES